MERYAKDFEGIPGGFATPEGLDPNFRDGYQGMRMAAGPGQAAYGAYRLTREADLGTWGGFGGIHVRAYRPRLSDAVIPLEGGGAVTDPFHAPRFISDFDARGYRYSPTPDSGERERTGEQLQRSRRSRSTDDLHNPEYSNHGRPPAGFGEGWARGPMRGSR